MTRHGTRCATWAIGAMVMLIALTATRAVGQDRDDLAGTLEKALFAEEVEGDLDKALKLYKEVIAQAKTQRAYVAQAWYRLGRCYRKTKQPDKAIEAFRTVVEKYPDQDKAVALAKEQIRLTRSALGVEEVARIVKEVVMKVSTLAETDPELKDALARLDGLDANVALRQVETYFEASAATVRRAAIYVCYQGQWDSIKPVADKLVELCDHDEALTRGMAALALGQRKVARAYQRIARMTRTDKSSYARRAAAYALGLLGDPRAREVLQEAKEDEDESVAGNARHALRMLRDAEEAGLSDRPDIVDMVPPNYATDVDPNLPGLIVRFDRKMIRGNYSWVKTGKPFPNLHKPLFAEDQRTCIAGVKDLEPGKVYWIEFNTPPYDSFASVDGAKPHRRVMVFATRSSEGKPTPIPPDWLATAKAINAADGVPPRVVATRPAVFANDVAPGKTTLSVTFSEKMNPRGWSWCRRWADRYPKTIGDASFDRAQRTCSLPVALEGGTVYWVEINQPPFTGFRSLAGEKARSHVLLFATRDEHGEATPIPPELIAKAKKLNAVAEGLAAQAASVRREAWQVWRKGLYAKAETLFEQAVKLDASDADAWNGLGWSRFNLGKRDEAADAFGTCLAIQPEHAAALNGLGWLARAAGKADEAIVRWRKAVAASPTATAPMNGLATTYMERGEYEQAAKWYRKWLAVEPGSKPARDGLDKALARRKGQAGDE